MEKKRSYFALFVLFVMINLLVAKLVAKTKENNLMKIMFIGNSYTFNNDLPQQIKKMSLEGNGRLSVEIKALTPGGAKLADHLNSSFTLKTIKNGNWDIIILQGHSLEPLKNPKNFTKAAKELIQIAKESGADVFLFETWARAKGHWVYSEKYSGGDPAFMQEKLSFRYREIAKKTDVVVMPIGSTWHKLIKARPEIELYGEDGSHPTQIGSYLNACIIYNYVFKKDPKKLKNIPSTIEASEAKILQKYASILDEAY